MTTDDVVHAPPSAGGIGFSEKWLSVWVGLCIVAGIVLGNLLPGLFGMLAGLESASVNIPVAILIRAMVYPMMMAVDFGSLRHIGERPKGLVLTLVVNWLIKPFTMVALGVLFFDSVFADLIAPADAQEYVAGLILHGDGLRLVSTHEGGCDLYAGAGLGQRYDHGLRLCLCTDRDFAALGGALCGHPPGGGGCDTAMACRSCTARGKCGRGRQPVQCGDQAVLDPGATG